MGKKMKKWTAVLMLFVIVSMMISGCRSTTKSVNNTEESQDSNNAGSESKESTNENVAMGRYVEETTDLSDKISGYNNRLYKLSDGQLIITDKYGNFIKSRDNGVTWESYQQEWLSELLEDETYIFSLAVGLDGTVYVVHEIDKNEALKEDVSLQEDSQEEDAESEGDPFTLYSRLMIIKPDGSQQIVESPVEDKYINDVWVSNEGRVFITLYGEPIYEVLEDGSCEKFLNIEGSSPDLIQFQDNLMIIDGYGYDYDGYLIYDMEKKTYLEDEVLADFINENYKDRDTNGGSWFDLYFFPEEEDVLYLAGKKGLYRHVIGGSVIEQVIDGSLSSLSNPAMSLMGILSLDNNEFLALFSGGKLVRFTYDPNVPTVPDEKLKVYSLKENDLIRQAISLYQTANPTVFVEYEIGMEENSSITREDALKNLNTKIMAGNGPDVLILDNLPMDSYIDKGFLKDLSPVLEEMTGENALFENIVDSFEQDGSIYAVPCEISLPAVYGKEEYISQMKDLNSMADTVEKMREDYPEKNLVAICSEKGIMKMFAMSSVPAWKTQSGDIDTEKISDFLIQTKRIYDAQMDGLPQEIIEQWNSVNEDCIQYYGYGREDSEYFRWGLDDIRYIGGGSLLESGYFSYSYGYAMTTSVSRIKNFEDTTIIQMPGQSKKVFYPRTMVGISTTSNNADQAEDFLRVLLGKENQSSTFIGFPVNQAAFEEGFVIDESNLDENGVYGVIASSDGEGHYIEMDIYWLDEEQINDIRNWMESVDTPYIEDIMLEDAVYEEGTKYMEGSQSLDEAVAAIEEKVALYMAE